MSFGFDLRPLIQSIDEIGLIDAPLMLRDRGQKDELSVITGYKRILALRELRAEHVTCRILSGSTISPLRLSPY
ncbi:MAG: ParB N-terminal domain-containing protein [Deltaproteobacteria bacterium]|nr:ParB N-terminal domain-containing protein [Deltaproteobacteria bacterium]